MHDPLFSNEELARYGFTAHTLGEAVDVAILQADHAEYRELGPANFPGLNLLADGRNTTDPAAWRAYPPPS